MRCIKLLLNWYVVLRDFRLGGYCCVWHQDGYFEEDKE
jgi:hypothetical protein